MRRDAVRRSRGGKVRPLYDVKSADANDCLRPPPSGLRPRLLERRVRSRAILLRVDVGRRRDDAVAELSRLGRRRRELDAFGDCMMKVELEDWSPDAYNPASPPCADAWKAVGAKKCP